MTTTPSITKTLADLFVASMAAWFPDQDEDLGMFDLERAELIDGTVLLRWRQDLAGICIYHVEVHTPSGVVRQYRIRADEQI
jgi:hypothetical protein